MIQCDRRMSETDSRNVNMCLVNPTEIFKEDIIQKWKNYQKSLTKSEDSFSTDSPMIEDTNLVEFL